MKFTAEQRGQAPDRGAKAVVGTKITKRGGQTGEVHTKVSCQKIGRGTATEGAPGSAKSRREPRGGPPAKRSHGGRRENKVYTGKEGRETRSPSATRAS